MHIEICKMSTIMGILSVKIFVYVGANMTVVSRVHTRAADFENDTKLLRLEIAHAIPAVRKNFIPYNSPFFTLVFCPYLDVNERSNIVVEYL